jgi:hypothetical protein
MGKHTTAFVAVMSLVSIGPVYAQANSSQQRPPADPNERVCEDVVQTGSRLATKRFCGTRAQWADKQRQDREAVEKAQMNPCMITHTSPSGKASC